MDDRGRLSCLYLSALAAVPCAYKGCCIGIEIEVDGAAATSIEFYDYCMADIMFLCFYTREFVTGVNYSLSSDTIRFYCKIALPNNCCVLLPWIYIGAIWLLDEFS